MNRLSNHLLFVAIAAVAGTGLLVWLSATFPLIQAIVGLFVVLILPGYALVELFMGRRTLDTVQHLFMTLSTSLAIAILGGLVLNQLPFGIQVDGWVAIFVSATIGGGLLAWLFRHRRRPEAMIMHRVPVRIGQLLFIGIAVMLAGGALTMARTPASPDHFAGYSMLWLTPTQGMASNELQLGIDSKEFAPTQYRLEFLVDETVAQEWPMIDLTPNQRWQAKLALSAEQRSTSTIEAKLYRLDNPDTIYRHVLLRPMLSDVAVASGQ